MITKGIMEILHESIQIYDELCGKSYLLLFGSKNKYEYIEIVFKQSAFWHLLGCELEPDSMGGKANTYAECKKRHDILDKVTSIHNFSEILEKSDAMKNVFNFIEKAKEIKIGCAANCPEQYLFRIGSGNENGIIGYDYPNYGNRGLLFPKSAQLKSISKISRNTDKVLLILSKELNQRDYFKIEYEIKKGIYSQVKEYLPDNVKIKEDS